MRRILLTLFLSFGLANYLNDTLGSSFLGYLIVGGFYLLDVIIIGILAKRGSIQGWIEKLILAADNQRTNSHAAIIGQFDELYVQTGLIPIEGSFSDLVYQIKQRAPERDFALNYIEASRKFLNRAIKLREQQLETTA